jgi:hypothetical protein
MLKSPHMTDKPKVVLLEPEEERLFPGGERRIICSVKTNVPGITHDKIVSDLVAMGIRAGIHHEDAVDHVIQKQGEKRGFGLSRQAKNNWDDIDWGHSNN